MPCRKEKKGICSGIYKVLPLGWDIQGPIISGELLHLINDPEKYHC